MNFVYHCLAVKDVKRPFATRCKNSTGKNGILCDEHMGQAKRGPVNVLMHQSVTKTFGIKFKNQVTVTIDLSGKKKNVKPESVTSNKDKVRHTKNYLREQMQGITIEELKYFHDNLKLNIWKDSELKNNEYAFKYNMVKSIIDALYDKSIK